MTSRDTPPTLSHVLSRLADFDGRSVEPFRAVAQELPQTSESIVRMLALARDARDPLVSIGTSWIVKNLLESGVEPPDALAEKLIDELAHTEAPDAQLHLLQCLPLAPLTADRARRLMPMAEALIEASNTFVRAWAYNALGLVAEAEPSLRDSVLQRFAAAEGREKASVRVRIRKARERLLS